MKPRITVLTLGVDDLDVAVSFYRDGLGLRTEGIVGTEFEHGAVAFFDLQPGLRLALWPRRSISHDAGVPSSPRSATEFTIGHNVNSREAVDDVMAEAAAAGAAILKPHKTRSGAVTPGTSRTPDGHLWEIVWNPELSVED